MKFLRFKDKNYPLYTAEGNAAQFILPFAKYFCKETLIITGQDLNYSFAVYAKKISEKIIPTKHKQYISL